MMCELYDKPVIIAGDSSPPDLPTWREDDHSFLLHLAEQVPVQSHGVLGKERHDVLVSAQLEELHAHLNAAPGELGPPALSHSSTVAHGDVKAVYDDGAEPRPGERGRKDCWSQGDMEMSSCGFVGMAEESG